MKKLLLLFTLFFVTFTGSEAQIQTLQKLGQLSFNTSCAGVWHYADASGNEYALLGNGDALVIVDVTIPTSPTVIHSIPAANSLWREVTTYSHYAYSGTEGGGGITIVDLSGLPASVNTKTYTGDGAIAGLLDNSHTVQVFDGFLYIFGSNIGTVICDLTDPWNPTYAGSYINHYVHDGYVLNDTLYSSEIYDGQFSVVDISDKANPVIVTSEQTPGMFNHNGWFSGNNQYFYTTDELPNTPLGVFDVSDVNDIKLVNTFYNDTMPDQEVHNVRVIDDFLINPSYGSQITIVDGAQPLNLIEIARYQTGGYLCWDASPYLPSGNIIATDMDGEFYVFAPYYVRACYLEGNITDINTSLPINNALVEILGTTVNKNSNLSGDYKTGYPTSGTFDVRFSAPGYISETINGVVLSNGVVTTLDVQLESLSVSVEVIDAITLLPVPNARIKMQNSTIDIDFTADANGMAVLNSISSSIYDITAALWGYKSNCVNTNVNSSGTITIAITPGIYDDFTFDFGWTATGTAISGMWVREEPVGTVFGTTQANPDFDSNNDCSDRCFITGNGGGNANNDDVDDGTVILTSPVFDLSGYSDPYLNYETWFYEQFTANPNLNDTMFIEISNGSTTELVEFITGPSPTNSSWVASSFRILDFITPGNTMSVTITLSDKVGTGNPLEGGFDRFEITEGPTGVDEVSSIDMNIYPNPFNHTLSIATTSNNNVLKVLDVTGRVIVEIITTDKVTELITESWSSGVYLIQITDENNVTKTLKAIK